MLDWSTLVEHLIDEVLSGVGVLEALEEAQISSRGWIAPDNNYFDVGSMDHQVWASKNAQLVQKYESQPDRNAMLDKGWIQKVKRDAYRLGKEKDLYRIVAHVYRAHPRWAKHAKTAFVDIRHPLAGEDEAVDPVQMKLRTMEHKPTKQRATL